MYILQAVEVKIENQFDTLNAMDLISSVIVAFSDKQSMAANNLFNLYINEDLRDFLPHLILNTVFTQIFHLVSSTNKLPIFYTALLNTLTTQTKDSSLFRDF